MVKRTTEDRKNVTEMEVLEKLKTLVPLLQQEYLENLLQRYEMDPNLRILASRKLAELHAARGMWASAARIMTNAAASAERFSTAQELYMSAASLSIKAGDYLLADDNIKGAVEVAAPSEKARVQGAAADMYMSAAAELDQNGKMTKAVQIYERILKTTRDQNVSRRIRERLVVLYEKLGKIQESMRMKASLDVQ